MDWEKYKKTFTNRCKELSYSDNQINEYLVYAESLYKKNLPIIYDNDHLSVLLGYHKDLLLKISNSPNPFYRVFYIQKRNGKKREISEPYPTLKEIQYWILNKILKKVKISKYAKAYYKGRSVIDNARFHKGQNVIIKLDVKDFFSSIQLIDIIGIFSWLGYSKTISNMLARLCCLNECLTQGSPTSPALSNIFAIRIDNRIGDYVTKLGFRYTRYSDDITISGDISDKQISSILKHCKKVLSENNLEIQNEKTKVLRKHQKQYVTGIIVNEKLSIDSKIKRKIRQDIYYIKKYGLNSHMSHCNIEKENYLNHILGIINWVLFVEPKNEEFIQYKKDIVKLISSFCL